MTANEFLSYVANATYLILFGATVADALRRRRKVAVDVALFFAAPFVGLAYIIALPFVGLGTLVYIAVKAARK